MSKERGVPVIKSELLGNKKLVLRKSLLDASSFKAKSMGNLRANNVFGRSQSGTIKVSGPTKERNSGSMANLPQTDLIVPSPFKLGDPVLISGVQHGILRYFGETEFKPGLWCGIELPSDGNHDGMVEGVRYFQCPENCGIFAPLSKVSLYETAGKSAAKPTAARRASEPIKRHNPDTSLASHKGPGKRTKESKKRRKMEEFSLSSPPTTLKNRVPNFAEIKNEVNLRDEMERSLEGELSGRQPLSTSTPLEGKEREGNTAAEDGGSLEEFESCLEMGDTFVVFQAHEEARRKRPNNWGSGQEFNESTEDSPDEITGTTGLFGQTPPEFADDGSSSFGCLSSPDEAGIQEESSFGLGTPSHTFDLDDMSDIYSHLRSPSVDNLELDEDYLESKESRNELEQTVIYDSENTELDGSKPTTTDKVETSPIRPESRSNQAVAYGSDSDFHTESESEPSHRKNRDVRLIDGKFYTRPSNSSSSHPCGGSELDSTSSGIYSSSECGSVRGSEVVSTSTSSKSDHEHEEVFDHFCEEDQTIMCGSSSTSHTDSTTSSVNDSAHSEHVAQKNKEEKKLENIINNNANGQEPPAQEISQKKKVLRKKSVDDLSLRMGSGQSVARSRVKQLTAFEKSRSQSVACISLALDESAKLMPAPSAPLNARTRSKISSVFAETVASSNRSKPLFRGKSAVGEGVRGYGSSANLATTSAVSPAPTRRTMGTGNKWDSVMQKINAGKGSKPNLKEVKGKVFEQMKVRIEKGKVEESVEGMAKGVQRTDSTTSSSDCSDKGKLKKHSPKYRSKKEPAVPPDRQASDMSSGSEPISKSTLPSARNSNNCALSKDSARTKGKPSPRSRNVSSNLEKDIKPSRTSMVNKSNNIITGNNRMSLAPPTASSKAPAAAPKNAPDKGPATTSTKPTATTRVSSRLSTKSDTAGPTVKPLRDHNRNIPRSTKEQSLAPAAEKGRLRQVKEVKEEQVPSLKEQVTQLRVQVDLLRGENEGKGRSLSESRKEVERLSLSLQALGLVIQKFQTKCESLEGALVNSGERNSALTEELATTQEKVRSLLETNTELIRVNEGIRGDLTKLNNAHSVQGSQLEDQQDKLGNLQAYYEEELAKKEKAFQEEIARLKETRNVEIEHKRKLFNSDQPRDVLLEEIRSLNAVIELRNQQVKELQTKSDLCTTREEELAKAESLIKTLSARVENMEAAIENHRQEKKEMAREMDKLLAEIVELTAQKKALQQTVDQLNFRLRNPDVIQLSPSASNFKEDNSHPSSNPCGDATPVRGRK